MTFLVLLFITWDLDIFFLPAQAPPWLPLSPDCPRPGTGCGCSAFLICPGQRNVPSEAPPLAGGSSLLSFSLGAQPFTSFYWKTLFQTFLQGKCHFHNWPLDSVIIFLYFTILKFVFFSFTITVKAVSFSLLCFSPHLN